MSSHQASSKPRSSKCRNFCFHFDLHNYCPICRESGKGDDPCVTNLSPCNICANFTEEQLTKIKHRRRYTRKQKSSDLNTSKDDFDLLGDDEESFAGSQADLESAAENLFSSPPCPQPSRFESLSLKTPHNVLPTPGTALQNKIESRLEKSLGSSLNIQLKQEMGVFQASMLEVMKSLRDEMLSFQKASKWGVVKTSDSAQAKPLSGTSSQPDPPTRTSNPTPSKHLDVQPMDLEPYGPPLPLKSSHQPQSEHASKHSDVESKHSECLSDSEHKKHSDKKKHKSKPSHISQSSAEEDESSVHVKKPTKSQHKVPPEPQLQDSTDPVFYREVDMSDLPSQYTEEVETFRQIFDLPDPRETLPRSSTTVLGLDDEKGQQELRPRGPSAILPLNPVLKDAFEKFEKDFLASNLPEGKYIKPPASTAKYYKVGQPCFEDKLQELNTDFAKICISPKPSGAPFKEGRPSPLLISQLLLLKLLLHVTLF